MTTTAGPPVARPVAPPVAPGTIQVWSDLLCPFAHVAVHRLRRARERLGLPVRLDHHAFPLELFNGPHPRRGTDTEAVGLGQVAPEAGFRVWTAADDLYPHTVLLAAEAVLAAKAQSAAAAEALDVALRRAFWLESRSVGHRQVILDIAAEAAETAETAEAADTTDPGARLDVAALADALDSGRHRRELMADFAVARTDAIPGSPTLRLPDGTTVTNPGVTVHWEGPWAAGYPVVDADDAAVYDDLLRRAARPVG
jgi:predicted DsbA family dithiol-disulfide isomerase